MRTVVFLLVAAIFALVAGDGPKILTPEERKELLITCEKETGHSGGHPAIKLDDASKEAKCFVNCVMKKKGIVKEDGTIDTDIAKAESEAGLKLSGKDDLKEKFIKAIDECAPKGEDLKILGMERQIQEYTKATK